MVHFFLAELPALDLLDLLDSLPDKTWLVSEDERDLDLALLLDLELTSELVTEKSEFLEELLPLESEVMVMGLSID